MAVKKRFPYQAAFVACNGGCRATADCQYGCVGCGRCLAKCPIHKNIVKVVKTLGEEPT